MPSRKKGKGKARKSKAKASHEIGGNDAADEEVDAVADSLSGVLSMEDMMAKMRGQIVTSLGDDYDDQSLLRLDRKMCDYFLPKESFYYDDEANIKSASPEKPTDSEVKHYKKSDVIRKGHLRKAAGFEATSNFLGGQGSKNLPVYQKFYDDLMSYHYAWFEIIFRGDKSELYSACMTIVKFATVKLEEREVDAVHNLMTLIRELKDQFQLTVKEHDVEACENAGILEGDFYELSYKMSIEMAKAKKKDEAEEYFEEALSMETSWGYEDRHCAKVLEFAMGRRLSTENLFDISCDIVVSNDVFCYKCLQAYLHQRPGSVSMKSLVKLPDEDEECCNYCGKSSTMMKLETGKNLMKCTRCKIAPYCGKTCQVADWKRGHKRECN